VKLSSFLSSIDSLHERQDREVKAALRKDPRISSFERIKRNSEGLGGGELIVDKTRQSIICLIVGPLGLLDSLSHRVMDEEYVIAVPLFTRLIHEKAEGFTESSDFTLVRNASSSDLITAVRDGGLKTGIIIQGHGCKTWVNMTDGGKRVTNNMLRGVVGDEMIGAIVKATCNESHIEDNEIGIPRNEDRFEAGITRRVFKAPHFI
jgi:hypothetical protein